MNVIELKKENVNALLIPEIQALLKRAIEGSPFVGPAGWDSVATDIFNLVVEDSQFLLLGAEKGEFRAVIGGYFPVGNLFPYPTVLLFYNEGSRALSRALQDRLLEIIVERGYTKMLAVNGTLVDDKVWQRALTPKGATAKRVGSLVLFEVS